MRALLLLLVLLFSVLLSCKSPLGNEKEEEKDPRTSIRFDLYSLPGGLVSQGNDSPRLWEGEDGARFVVHGGFLDCFAPPTAFEKLFWTLYEPPDPETSMVYVRANGSVTVRATCELTGQDGIVFKYPDTGETVASRAWEDSGGCWHLDKRLPSEEALRLGTGEGDEIPSYVVFPDPLPIGTFRDGWCDVTW